MSKIHVTYSDSRGVNIQVDVVEDIAEKIAILLTPSLTRSDDNIRLEFNRKQREAYQKRMNNEKTLQNAYIYLLTFGNNSYVGHTTSTLRERMLSHIRLAKQYNKNENENNFYNTLFEFEKPDVSIESLAFYPEISKIELLFKEDYYIEKMKPNMNTRRAVNARLKKKYPQFIVKSD